MAKKKSSGGGGANWMDTYGDMVTLLLCFFVLLYSMSTISEDKWKAIVQSFNPSAILAMTDPGGKEGPFADPDAGDGAPGLTDPADLEAQQAEIDDMIAQLAQAISDMVAEEGLESAIQVELAGGVVYVRFSDTVFFRGDDYHLQPRAQEILLEVCDILDTAKDAIEVIEVQGHTAQAYDNTPNNPETDRFLSSNRATMVALFIQQHSSIFPGRLTSTGMGQWRPIADNKGEAGKAPNRRVEMIISGRDLNAEALGESLSRYEKGETAES